MEYGTVQVSPEAIDSPAKPGIIAELRQPELLLPTLVGHGLEANDRAKYLFTLLQAARFHALHPEMPAGDLSAERGAADIDDARFDMVVAGARASGDDRYFIPGATAILSRVVDALAAMLEAVRVGAAGTEADRLADRLERLRASLPSGEGDVLSGQAIDAITSADRHGADSVHLLVMDLHRALNRLQARMATERLDGASAYGLADADRPLVRAFMRGLASTERLRLDHPGLGTTATRAGDRLLIQNDIGETAAHVLVLRVVGLTLTLTYTDVHRPRLDFFQDMLRGTGMRWSSTATEEGRVVGAYSLCTGVLQVTGPGEMESALERIGSRLVFLIDWNRARRRLVPLVGKQRAIELLQWAAATDCGHMAFLRMGGERLVFDAIETSAAVPVRYGQPLVEVIGEEATVELLRFALRAASEAAQAGHSELLVRDQVRVELMRALQGAEHSMLTPAAEHASLVVEIALALHEALLRQGTGAEGDAFTARSAARGREWEHRADELVNRVRTMVRHAGRARVFERLLITGDDAIDDLEEALFLLTLLDGDSAATPLLSPLRDLAELAVRGAEEHLKAVEAARHLAPGMPGEDLQDLIEAVDAVLRIEHDADEAARRVTATVVRVAPDLRCSLVVTEMARRIEEATDALMRSVLLLRDHVLLEGTP